MTDKPYYGMSGSAIAVQTGASAAATCTIEVISGSPFFFPVGSTAPFTSGGDSGWARSIRSNYLTGYNQTRTGTVRVTVTDGGMSVTKDLNIIYTTDASYLPMSGSLTDVSGSTVGTGAFTVGTVTASVSGGGSSKSYIWSISGAGFAISGSGSTATVTQASEPVGTYTGQVTCVVSDGTSSITLHSTATATRTASYVPMSGSISAVNGSYQLGIPANVMQEVGISTADIAGGDAPRSFAWSISGNDDTTWQVSSDNAQDSTGDVSAYTLDVGTHTATITCVVSDASGHSITRTAQATLTVEDVPYTAMTGSMDDVSGSAVFAGNTNIGTAVADVSGGNSAKTYTFTKLSGDTAHFTLSPSGSSCAITANRARFDTANYSMTLRCVVDDGTDTLTLDCTVTDNYTM
ncbi:MAG TPA: hypothetical protein VFG73_02185 [Rhodanobacteraceae bacterium]|nr:hypothetical protein [Rhodanobacteraceae bacterium]